MNGDTIFGGTMGMTLIIACCIAIPFLGIAVYLVINALRSNAQVKASQAWQSAMGTVLASSVEVSHSTDSEGHRTTSYYPNVTYQYQVQGQTYQNNRIAFGFRVGSGSSRKAQAVVNRYALGTNVSVFYDPANPADAVLERTSSSRTLTWVAALIIAILCCTTVPILFFMTGLGGFLSTIYKMLP